MEPVRVTHPFPPLFDSSSRILILGSFPSIKSREQAFFYGHPQNRFWRMLAAVYDEPVPVTIPEKRTLALSYHIAMWDVIQACTITGSSDASVRDVVPTDLSRIFSEAPIRLVICNGSLSGKLYGKYQYALTGVPALTLPSTSPANAACSLSKLTEVWRQALNDPAVYQK